MDGSEQSSKSVIPTSVDEVASADAAHALYRRLVQSRGSASVHDVSGRLRVPYALMLLDPTLGTAIEALGSRLRLDSPLPLDVREVAILGVASAAKSRTQWAIHLPIARRADITTEELGEEPDGTPSFATDIRQTVWRLAHAWMKDGTGQGADRHRVLGRYGPTGLYELVTTVGYYRMLATQLAVFEAR